MTTNNQTTQQTKKKTHNTFKDSQHLQRLSNDHLRLQGRREVHSGHSHPQTPAVSKETLSGPRASWVHHAQMVHVYQTDRTAANQSEGLGTPTRLRSRCNSFIVRSWSLQSIDSTPLPRKSICRIVLISRPPITYYVLLFLLFILFLLFLFIL